MCSSAESAEGSHTPPTCRGSAHCPNWSDRSAADGARERHASRGVGAAKAPPGGHVDAPTAEAVEAEPETEQFLLMRSVVQVLEIATERAPIIVVLDDLQWADSSSLALLKIFHRFVGPGSEAWSCAPTARATWPPTTPWRPFWRFCTVSPSSIIDLGGLGEDDIVDLFETLAGEELDDRGYLPGSRPAA